ncbi:MAG: prolyl oligopeptidase family serine peptidase, partial [Pseudomonadota bacterium]
TNREFAEDIYEVNLKNGLSKRVYRGATGENAITDYSGAIRGKTELAGNDENTRFEFSYKNPETGKWEQHHALYAAAREGMQPVGFGTDGRTVYMTDNTGRDKNIIRKYDLITRQMSEELFGGDSFEALNIIQSTDAENFGELIGFVGAGAEIFREYTSPKWKDLQARIDSALPKGQRHTVTAHSEDYSIMVINSTGPKEPGAYYLLVNGSQLVALGRSMPNLKPELLADMQFVTYTARDGRDVPGYLTLPKEGKPPYPTIINPHGGPWARDYLGWDLWAQYLANQGYAVLQPQYRGSQGWGQDLWRAGDGKWGFEMQDDKDDGAKWLVEEGIADPDRLAMFGYSYGGYAAMAAIVRQDAPYQCAIAGAGLSELRYFDKVTFENPFGREFQNPTIKGLSPYDHAKQAVIPIFIFHGDRDQRVPIEQSRKYVSALKKAKKDVEYLEIPDLWHSYPWWPKHHRLMLTSLTDYLENRCGPDGI